MERTSETTAAQALQAARHFLTRWRDRQTSNSVDDLAQDAVIEAWLRRDTLQRPDRWPAFVRTIARRCRYRTLQTRMRLPTLSLDADTRLGDELVESEFEPHRYRVADEWVSAHWCLEELDDVLEQLSPLNRHIVRRYYEGFSCSELAERYGLPEEAVKVRLYRSRNRIRREFEGRVDQAAEGEAGPSLAS